MPAAMAEACRGPKNNLDQRFVEVRWQKRTAEASDYSVDYAINPDGSLLLKSRAIPYRIEAHIVLDGPNSTGRRVWWYLDYGDWGITRFCFAPGAGG